MGWKPRSYCGGWRERGVLEVQKVVIAFLISAARASGRLVWVFLEGWDQVPKVAWQEVAVAGVEVGGCEGEGWRVEIERVEAGGAV